MKNRENYRESFKERFFRLSKEYCQLSKVFSAKPVRRDYWDSENTYIKPCREDKVTGNYVKR